MSILKVVEFERHVPKTVTRYPSRKPVDLRVLARTFVTRALYHCPTTSNQR